MSFLDIFKMGVYQQASTSIYRGLLLFFLLCLDNSASDVSNEKHGTLPHHKAVEENSVIKRIIMPRIIVDDSMDANLKITVKFHGRNESAFIREFYVNRKSYGKDSKSRFFISQPDTLSVEDTYNGTSGTSGTEEAFICANISMTIDEYRLAPDSVRMQKILESVNVSDSANTITVCKTIIQDEVVEKYPSVTGIVMSSVIYTSVSLVCAFACIISVPKFLVIFISSNIVTYFLICFLLTGSFVDVLVFFIPIHLNIMFFFVSGWVTLMSCKVMFKQLKIQKILHVIDGNVVGNACPMYELILAFSCLIPFITLLGIKPMILATDNTEESMYINLMAHFTPSLVFLLLTILGVDVVFTSQRKNIKEFGINHTRNYFTFFCYNTLAVVTWVYGFIVVTFPHYPHFWRMYMFTTTALPIFFIKDVIMSARVKFFVQVAQPGNTDEIYKIRLQHA